jgi:hypothetical protein
MNGMSRVSILAIINNYMRVGGRLGHANIFALRGAYLDNAIAIDNVARADINPITYVRRGANPTITIPVLDLDICDTGRVPLQKPTGRTCVQLISPSN